MKVTKAKLKKIIKEESKRYNMRHGGPYDRGGADSYYMRRVRPHYFKGGTHTSEEVTEENMTPEEIEAYMAGYDDNEETGDFKQWD